MLVDPAYQERIYSDRPIPGLTAADRALLTAVDRRAWNTDPLRRARLVQALLEEFPVTTAVVGVPAVDAFFSSAGFRSMLECRGSMALSFADWIRGRSGDIAALEGAIARARRGRDPALSPGLQTAPGVIPVTVQGGTLSFMQQAMASLGPTPTQGIAQGVRLSAPATSSVREHLLVEADPAGQVNISPCDRGLVALLAACAKPTTKTQASRHARRLGADPADAGDIVQQLLSEGLLVDHSPPTPTEG